MVVADGMGGHLHGEVASQITVQYLTEAFQRDAKLKLADPPDFLRKGIREAHFALADYAKARGLSESPRTTCVACVVQDSIAHWAHVGDSRLYHVRRGQVQAQTRDHSRVQVLIDRGRIREEAVAAHPDRNKIFNCIGAATPPEVELSQQMPLQQGDTLLLCTDGLWGPLTRKLITAALLRGDNMKAMPELLGPWSDCYSIGASIFACLSGMAPQAADERLEKDRYVSATKLGNAKYSRQLLETVDWCLELDHLKRPQSVFALQKVLMEEKEPEIHRKRSMLDTLRGAWMKGAGR